MHINHYLTFCLAWIFLALVDLLSFEDHCISLVKIDTFDILKSPHRLHTSFVLIDHLRFRQEFQATRLCAHAQNIVRG